MHSPLEALALNRSLLFDCLVITKWRTREKALRELRQTVTVALVAECDTLEQVTPGVEELFTLLAKADRIGSDAAR